MKYSRIFQFSRASDDAAPSLLAAEQNTNDDEIHQHFFDQLRTIFHTHARKQFGLFDSEITAAILPKVFTELFQQQCDAEQAGLQIAARFNQCLLEQEQQQGILWFILESTIHEDFVYLFFLKPEESQQISPQLTIKFSTSIDPARLQYALKLNLREWQQQKSPTYLMYLAPKNQLPLTLAWHAFTGFSAGINRAEQTETFLTVIDQFAEALPAEKEQDYRSRIIDFCLDKDRVGEPVSVAELSRHVDDAAPEALLNFIAEKFEAPTPTLYPDRKQLKRYTRFYGRAADLTISFSTLLFGSNILYDESTETLTIRALPESLKSQLQQYLKKSD